MENDDTIASVSLNGAQIQSLLSIVQSVNDGILEYDSAIELIISAFPFDKNTAIKILGNKKDDLEGDDGSDAGTGSTKTANDE